MVDEFSLMSLFDQNAVLLQLKASTSAPGAKLHAAKCRGFGAAPSDMAALSLYSHL